MCRCWAAQMIDEVLIQGGLAAAAGLGVAVGGIYFIEKKAAMGAEVGQLSQEQVNKFAMEGSDAENKFSGSDQTLDDLIAAMETAQVLACFMPSRALCVAGHSREEQVRAPSARSGTAHGCSTRTHCGW